MSSVTAPADAWNLDSIYNENYSYSLPRNVLETWIKGGGFGGESLYTKEEQARVFADATDIFQSIMSTNPEQRPLAVMTAGGPGAGKTIKMRQELEGKNIIYICPDDVCLKQQTRTYKADMESGGDLVAGYHKWRPASNAITHWALGKIVQDKYAFYFGTTSTGAKTGSFFEFLKQQGYEIELLHVSAPDDVRWDSIRERDKEFVQTTEKDVEEKGKLLFERIQDTYLAYADTIKFYYRDEVDGDARLAACWTREEGGAIGNLAVYRDADYQQIKNIHNAGVASLGRPDISWENTVEANSR